LTDVTEEDLFTAILFGVSVRISTVIHDAAASVGLEGPLTLGVFILLAVLIATNHPGRSN
jgi:hypothetical protein